MIITHGLYKHIQESALVESSRNYFNNLWSWVQQGHHVVTCWGSQTRRLFEVSAVGYNVVWKSISDWKTSVIEHPQRNKTIKFRVLVGEKRSRFNFSTLLKTGQQIRSTFISWQIRVMGYFVQYYASTATFRLWYLIKVNWMDCFWIS